MLMVGWCILSPRGLAYGAAKVYAADAGDNGRCRGWLPRRASSACTQSGLPSVGQRRRTAALQHSVQGEAQSVTQQCGVPWMMQG
jgi:hypothetical protein